MNKFILVISIVLSACGGSTAPTVESKPVVIDKPAPIEKQSLLIYDNGGDQTLGTINYAIDNGYKAIILDVTYSQVYRDSVADCPACFVLARSVIISDDKGCDDCFSLSPPLFRLMNNNMKVFLVVNDELTLHFAEYIASQAGYADIVLTSTNEELLLSQRYNYELALIGEADNNNIDWHITENKDCSAKCISPSGLSSFDGAIVND